MITVVMIRVEAAFIAPIPVGHRVTVIAVDAYVTALALFAAPQAGQWQRTKHVVICDEDTRIVYAELLAGLHEDATYESLVFQDQNRRFSQFVPPLRGVVKGCVVLTDGGDTSYPCTRLMVEPDPV